MDTIESLVDELELENKREAAADPTTRRVLGLVEDFLKHHRVLCYGGTAINNLLPEHEQFYDFDEEVPDYDFFSETPQEHAMMIADHISTLKIPNVEVKPGMHLGTFKVFSEFQGVADVTYLEHKIFDRLWKEDIVRHGIHYVSPNFLRMSMYLELSRPKGDVSRWTKVYKRLQLLNKHYPLTCPAKVKAGTELDNDQKKEVIHLLKTHPIVLLGFSAAEVHAKRTHWTTPVTLLAEAPTIEAIVKGKHATVTEGNELIPRRTDFIDEDGLVKIRFYETQACHSYHRAADGIRVASIPTLLQFFYAYMYTDAPEDELTRILCVAQRLVDLADHGSREFALLTPKECLGHQESLIEMKRHRSDLYAKVSKDRESPEYLASFFTYTPGDRTKRTKTRNLLKKTLKR